MPLFYYIKFKLVIDTYFNDINIDGVKTHQYHIYKCHFSIM